MTDTNTAERESFEAWASQSVGRVWRDTAPGRTEDYQDASTNLCWRGWQARASLAASAGSEPVAEIGSAAGDDAEFGQRAIYPLVDIDHLEYGTKLYTRPSPPEGMAGWKPIETAPKDGTWVELWRTPTDCGRMSPFVIAKWDGTESMFVWPEFCDPFTKYGRGKADADIAEGDCYGSDDFTHWRALSAPPLPASAKEL